MSRIRASYSSWRKAILRSQTCMICSICSGASILISLSSVSDIAKLRNWLLSRASSKMRSYSSRSVESVSPSVEGLCAGSRAREMCRCSPALGLAWVERFFPCVNRLLKSPLGGRKRSGFSGQIRARPSRHMRSGCLWQWACARCVCVLE